MNASASSGSQAWRARWRLTWPVLPLIIVFVALWGGLPLLPPSFTIDGATSSLAVVEILEHRQELNVSTEMGKWWVGDGSKDEQLARWPVLLEKLDWSARRVIGILAVVGLALCAGTTWDFASSQVRRRSPVAVLLVATGIAVSFSIGANGMHYLMYSEFIHFGRVTENGRSLFHGEFSTWISLYSALVLAPIAEEILFRGWLQRLLTSFFKVWPALILQAIVFGMAHYPHQGINGFLMSGALGLLIGYVYIYTGKLWPCILCHSLMNLYGVWDDLWWIWNGRMS